MQEHSFTEDLYIATSKSAPDSSNSRGSYVAIGPCIMPVVPITVEMDAPDNASSDGTNAVQHMLLGNTAAKNDPMDSFAEALTPRLIPYMFITITTENRADNKNDTIITATLKPKRAGLGRSAMLEYESR